MALTSVQHRDFTRVRVPMTVRITTSYRGVRTCKLRDLGLGGVFVDADDCLRDGGECTLEIRPDSAPEHSGLSFSGRVVRIEPGTGTAIEFTAMTLDAFDEIDRLLAYDSQGSEPGA